MSNTIDERVDGLEPNPRAGSGRVGLESPTWKSSRRLPASPACSHPSSAHTHEACAQGVIFPVDDTGRHLGTGRRAEHTHRVRRSWSGTQLRPDRQPPRTCLNRTEKPRRVFHGLKAVHTL
eukprot:366311-Chlamydomonas_euryale.AAC.2